MRSKCITVGIVTVILVLLLAVAYAGKWYLAFSSHDIMPGIKVRDLNIGGMGKEEAGKRLLLLEKQMKEIPVTLTYGEERWQIQLHQVGFEIDKEATLGKAMQLGKKGNVVERLKTKRKISVEGYNLYPVVQVDGEKLAAVIDLYAPHLNVEPQDAAFLIDDNDRVKITPSRTGRRVNIEKIKGSLEKEILASSDIVMAIPVEDVPPAYSTEDIENMGIDGLLSTYTTKFDASLINRSYNIKVAANALDGLLVTPGQEVSFNEVVGPRSSEAGYKSAQVIINNEFVEDVGGGVCQVSSTLYNAVLLADLIVSHRKNHSIPVTYVPIGRDATVVYEYVDFKFQNNTGRCLYIKATVGEGQLTIKIFGNSRANREVIINSWIEEVIEPEIIYEEDENLKQGQQVVKQEGVRGYVAHAERVVMIEGVVIKREQLPVSKYSPINKIIAVGTASPEPVIVPPKNKNQSSN
ncbi:VanW family protein [Desulfofalx alkaliphila]|uniref:VanW family protein n=1 Tax=Desulfofalx alkaliphila TaxID=105483 RepID=UPI00068E635F|nr:VanW family protein [Desulfofalx alkaliphila]